MGCPGEWNQRLKPAVLWWCNFDPYPTDWIGGDEGLDSSPRFADRTFWENKLTTFGENYGIPVLVEVLWFLAWARGIPSIMHIISISLAAELTCGCSQIGFGFISP